MTAEEIVERIMTDHWDMSMCLCWICCAGRAIGLVPRSTYLLHGKDWDNLYTKNHSEAIAERI